MIVFRAPEDPDKDFIKRVVAVGGDTVEVRDGVVYLNDEPVDEPFAYHGDRFGSHRDYPRTRIPPGEYFCLGDNRDNSRDSRFWGTVPRALVKGKAVVIYWSFDAPPGAYFVSGLRDRLLQVGRMLPNLLRHTRWERTFQLIR